MKRRVTAWSTFCSAMLGFVLTAVGCADNQIGRICLNPSAMVKNGVTFVNPAPDCPSRLCMITPKSAAAPADNSHSTSELSVCTAECNSDDDCGNADKSRCPRDVCAVASVVPGEENFCCKKLCICEYDLQAGFNKDGSGAPLDRDKFGVPIPKFCLPGAPSPTAGQPRNCPYIEPAAK